MPRQFRPHRSAQIVIYALNAITPLPEIINVMMSHTAASQDTLIAELSLVVNDFLARDILVAIQRRYNYSRESAPSIASSGFLRSVRKIIQCRISRMEMMRIHVTCEQVTV